MLMGDAKMKFSEVIKRANAGTGVLTGSAAICLFKIARKMSKAFLMK